MTTKKAQKSKFSNDNTSKEYGFIYQKLLVVESCINSQEGQTIYVECLGDVSDNDSFTMEVKHHVGKHNLSSSAEDAWKTIYNLVKEFEKVKHISRFILHSTSNIPNDSIFANWNDLDSQKRHNKLKSHTPTATIQKYYNDIFNESIISNINLLSLLSKFEIRANQENLETKIKQLKNSPYFQIIPEKLRGEALGICHSYIVEKSINNQDNWEINISDFFDDLRVPLSRFTKDYIDFPRSENITAYDINPDFIFVRKLNEIQIPNDFLNEAVEDYYRSEDSYNKILILNPSARNDLKNYEDDIYRSLKSEKS